MATPDPTYRPLPGRGVRRTGPVSFTHTRSRLWLGPDHLLCIDSTGHVEHYRRFYFNDVQAITIRGTNRGRNWDIALGLLSLAFAFAGIPAGIAGRTVFWSIAGLFFAGFVINWLRGPTCQCHVQSAVQQDQLPSINRWRVARKAVGEIQARIEQAQGTLSGEEVVNRLNASPALAAAASTASPGGRKPTVALSNYAGWAHRAAFYLLWAMGAAGLLDFFARHVAVVLFAMAIALAESVAAVIAVVRQYGSGLPVRLQRLTWWVIAFLVVNTIAGYIMYFALVIGRGGATPDQWEYINMIAQISPFDSPLQLAMSLFLVIGSFILGGLGVLWLRQFRPAPTAPANARPAPPQPTKVQGPPV